MMVTAARCTCGPGGYGCARVYTGEVNPACPRHGPDVARSSGLRRVWDEASRAPGVIGDLRLGRRMRFFEPMAPISLRAGPMEERSCRAAEFRAEWRQSPHGEVLDIYGRWDGSSDWELVGRLR